MAAIRTSTLPLLNPDTRPLPSGWTQHYNTERKLWIYLDMNVLPPRVSMTHPSGPPPPPPGRPGAAHNRGSPAGLPAWSSLNTPHRNALQARGNRLTVAQRLYSSALPPAEKAGLDEFGIPVNSINAHEIAPPAPSYGSIDPMTFTSSASPVSTTSTTTSASTSPTLPNIGRTPGRRPLPKPPVLNVAATTTSQRPAPSRPPDDPVLTQALDHRSESSMPLQPTPIKASDNISRQQVASATLSDTLLQAIPQAEPQPRDLPRYARKQEPPHSKASNNVPHRPVLPPSSSHTLPKKLSFVGQPVITTSASNTTLSSSSAHSPETPFQSPGIPSARVSMSSLARSNDLTYLGVPHTQSTTSLSSGPAPFPPPLTRGTSAPPTPEPTRFRFPPNLKPPVRNTFAPPEIVAMFNRQLASSSSAVRSDRDEARDSFDPMSLYSDTSHPASHPASLHASSPSPRSHEQTSLQVHQTLSQSTSSRTSMSSSVSPIPSAISASGSAGIHSHQSMHLATNNDPDLVETPKSSQDKSTKKDGGKKKGFRFGRMSFLPKKQSGADRLDLNADPLHDSSAKIGAELGKVIKDGFREVMGHNTHQRGEIQLPEPAGVASLQAQMQAMNMGSRISLPLQPQDTSGTLRPTTPQPNTLSPLPFPLNQSFSRATLRPNGARSPEASGSGSQNQNIPQISNSGERPGTPSHYRQSMASSPSFPSRLSPMLPSPRRESFQAPSTSLQAPLAHPLPRPSPQRQYNARQDLFDTPLHIPNTPAPEYQSSANTHIGSFYPFNSSPSTQYQPTGYGALGESPLE